MVGPCSQKHGPVVFTVLKMRFVWMFCTRLKPFKFMAGPRSPTSPVTTQLISRRMRKRFTKIFKDNGLNITIEANLTQTDFLDVTLDLTQNKHFPYRKPINDYFFINRQSNHPFSILKQLPHMIQARLSNLSSDEGKFTSAKFSYEEALKKWFQQFTLFLFSIQFSYTEAKKIQKYNLV